MFTEYQDYRLVDLPGYMAWSNQKLADGESAALIAHLDATSMWLHPSEVQSVSESDFEELLDDLRVSLSNQSED